MPLGYLRRPLFLALILYILLLVLLRGRGYFLAEPSPELLGLRFRPWVRLQAQVVSPLKEDQRGQKVAVRGVWAEDRAFAQKVLAYLPRDFAANAAIRPGHWLRLRGQLRLPRPARNPGDFDEKGFLAEQGIAWIMKAESWERLERPEPWPWRPWAWAEGARRSMESCFLARLPEEKARVLTGLCLGYKGPLSRGLNRAAQDAGVMHLLVPSGAKVAFVLLAAAWVSSRLGAPPLLRLGLAGLLGGFYTLMVGGEPPYARAYLGGMALAAGWLCGRESGAFQATVLSAWLILLHEPRALFSAGFQMTYAAMAGLLLAMPTVNEALPRSWPYWLKRVAATMAVTAIVQLMLWPIFANIFGRGSLAGCLANMLLVPASGLYMGAGFGFWGLSLAGAPSRLLDTAAGGLETVLSWFCRACFWFAAWPGAAVELSPMDAAAVLAYYLLVLALLVLPRKRTALTLACASLAVWGSDALAQKATEPALRVVYLRLPGASWGSCGGPIPACGPVPRAALVSFAGGRHWLVDAGGTAGLVLKALRRYRIKRLEKVVLTGREAGLRSALPRLAREIPIGRVEPPEAGRRLALLCQERVCFEFSPPRVRRGDAEFSIIPTRLKTGAVEASTDGFNVRIRNTR